jgi:hypothetical protein
MQKQRLLDADKTPCTRWARFNGWNLEHLASLQPYVVTAIMKKMHTAGDKAMPAELLDVAVEEIRQIRINSPPGTYRGGKKQG